MPQTKQVEEFLVSIGPFYEVVPDEKATTPERQTETSQSESMKKDVSESEDDDMFQDSLGDLSSHLVSSLSACYMLHVVCQSVYLSVFRSVKLVFLPACLAACLFVCLQSDCLTVCQLLATLISSPSQNLRDSPEPSTSCWLFQLPSSLPLFWLPRQM